MAKPSPSTKQHSITWRQPRCSSALGLYDNR